MQGRHFAGRIIISQMTIVLQDVADDTCGIRLKLVDKDFRVHRRVLEYRSPHGQKVSGQ